MRQNALEAEARANLAMRDQDKSDAIAVEQIAKLQRLAVAPAPAPVVAATVAPVRKAASPSPNYWIIGGVAALGALLVAAIARKS